MKKLILLLSVSVCAFAQSQIYGNRTFQAGYFDAANATATRPAKTGTTAAMPSTCNAGDQYFATDATAGKNLYICASANTWVQVSGTGAAGVNLQTASYVMAASDSGKLVVMNCNAACTLSFPAAPTNGYYSTVESIGSVIPVIALGGKQFNGSTSTPALNSYRPLAFWSDGSNFFGKAPVGAGSGINFSYAANGVTISATGGSGGWTSGTLANRPTTCAPGAAYFATDQPANQQLYTCSAANVWTQNMLLGTSGALAVTGGALDITSTVPQKGTPNEFTALNTFDPGYVLKEQASGSTPATGLDMFYVNSADHLLHMVNSAGTDTAIGSGGGGFTGTSGSVPFVGSGGTLTQDNAHLFWDATNHRLGIGTAAPSSEFDIVGAVGSAQFDASTGSANLSVTGSALPYLKIANSGTSKYWELVDNSDQSDGLMISPGTHTNGPIAANQTGSVFLGGAISDANAGTGASLAISPTAITANQPLTVGNITINGTCTGTGCTSGSSGVAIQQGGTAQGTVSTLNCSTNVTCSVSGSTATVTATGGGAATSLVDSNGAKAVSTTPTASAVNYLNVTNAAAGSGPSISAAGSDTNIDATLSAKGTGNVNLGPSSTPVQVASWGGLEVPNEVDLVGTGADDSINLQAYSGAASININGTSSDREFLRLKDTQQNKDWWLVTSYTIDNGFAITRTATTNYQLLIDQSDDVYLGGTMTGTGSGANVSILSAENGHIYTHGTAPAISGTNCYAGVEVANPTGTWTSGSTSVTVSSGTGIAVGQEVVSASGIAAGTTVSAVSGTTVTLSTATTAAGSSQQLMFVNTSVANNDTAGAIAVLGVATCTVTFNKAWTSIPIPQITPSSSVMTGIYASPSTTAVTIGNGGNVQGTIFYTMRGTN